MTLSPQVIAKRMAFFEQVCRDARIRLTHQRMEVFREVAQTGSHPDVETVFSGVRKRVPTISLDTVYRALRKLKELKLISVLGPGRASVRFDANLERHHHFVCLTCGLIRDFVSVELDGLKLPDSLNSLGLAHEFQAEISGLCWQCAKNSGAVKKVRKRRK